jgi:LPXTG-motif cell wall-anchored protein
MNWPVIIIVGLLLLGLLLFLIIKNRRDQKEFERQVNSDYHKTKDEEGDADPEEKMH